jgi:hypothetical protein
MNEQLFFSTFHQFYENFGEHNIISKTDVVAFTSGSIEVMRGKYIDDRIAAYIRDHMDKMISVELFQSGIKIDLQVIGDDAQEVKYYRTKLLILLCSYIQFLYVKYPRLEVTKPMKLYVFLSPFKKELASEGSLKPFNVNTGFTLFDPFKPYNTIVVYRKEELFKVLIHELTHYFRIDRALVPGHVQQELKTMFKISNDPHIHEAITDFWSCYVNILYFSLFNAKGDLVSLERFKEAVARNLRGETGFIVNQARKVMYHEEKCSSSRIISEDTHVVAYYILKAVMFAHFQEYIKDYDVLETKSHFSQNILKDVRAMFKSLCASSYSNTNKSLRMSSIDVSAKMKTI